MTDVRRPRLLDANLAEVSRLDPLRLELNLQTPGVSTATLTMAPGDAEPAMHAWVELYNQNGSVGIYRVTSPVTDYTQQATITLRHGIDSMADSVLAAQEEFNDTPATLLGRIMSAQTMLINGVAPWSLGDCAATSNIKMSLNYPRLSELLNDIEQELEGYMFVYDQTVWPWKLHVRAKPSTAACGMRMSRNITTISRTLTDNDLCTQLILSINSKVTSDEVTTTNTYIKTYDNSTAQAIYGVIQKTADIDTGDDLTVTTAQPVPSTPEADAWAARFLADHASPTVQIQITGEEFYQATGDTWDEAQLGQICQVSLPEYGGAVFNERAVNVQYPDALNQPSTVNISLANELPKFSSSIATLRKETAKLARSGRGAARSSASAEELEVWSKHVQYYGLALDGTGVLTLYESGIDMDPLGGVTIYSLQEGVQSLYSGITVNATEISSIVQKSGINSLGQNETLYSKITQNANKISLVVEEKNGSNVVNAASIVAGINSQDKTSSSYVDISANYINLSGYVTATTLDARLINADALFSNTGYIGTIRASAISSGGNITASGAVIGTGVYFGSAAPYTDVGNAIASFGSATESGGTVTIPTTKLNGNQGGPITFNVAGMAYYQNHIGIQSTGSWTWDSDDEIYYRTITPNAGSSADIGLPTITATAGNWSNNTCIVTVYGPNSHAITTCTVTAPTSGHDSVVGSEIDLNGSSAATSATMPTTALSKSTTTISGYIWFQLSDGTWKNLRSFSISTGATRATSLYSRTWDSDEQQYVYTQLQANRLYYRT